MKYIVFKSPEGPRVEGFAAPTTHADQAAAHPKWVPQSAGFVHFRSPGEVVCYGKSDSLNLSPGLHDASLIEVMESVTQLLCPPPPSLVRA